MFKEFQAQVVKEAVVHVARGGGPGGQSVNKSMNAVTLIHGPTGLKVNGAILRRSVNFVRFRALSLLKPDISLDFLCKVRFSIPCVDGEWALYRKIRRFRRRLHAPIIPGNVTI